jgi:hypothetical protein
MSPNQYINVCFGLGSRKSILTAFLNPSPSCWDLIPVFKPKIKAQRWGYGWFINQGLKPLATTFRAYSAFFHRPKRVVFPATASRREAYFTKGGFLMSEKKIIVP